MLGCCQCCWKSGTLATVVVQRSIDRDFGRSVRVLCACSRKFNQRPWHELSCSTLAPTRDFLRCWRIRACLSPFCEYLRALTFSLSARWSRSSLSVAEEEICRPQHRRIMLCNLAKLVSRITLLVIAQRKLACREILFCALRSLSFVRYLVFSTGMVLPRGGPEAVG